MKLVALTASASLDVTRAPFPITAVVLKVRTWMAADAATLASDLPPATAKDQTMKSFSFPLGVIASTVIGPPLTCEPGPMDAVFVIVSTLRPTPAPMATSDCRLVLKPIALAFAPIVFSLLTFTAPVDMTVGMLVPSPI